MLFAAPTVLAAPIVHAAPTVFAAAAVHAAPTPSRCALRMPFDSTADATVVDDFRAPVCERCAGNRGIEYSLRQGSSLLSASDGVVSFVGQVGQVKYLVVATKLNRRITYGRIESSMVRIGEQVRAGQPIAISTDSFYFGVREIDSAQVRYVDPNKYLHISATLTKPVLVRGADAAQNGGSGQTTLRTSTNAC